MTEPVAKSEPEKTQPTADKIAQVEARAVLDTAVKLLDAEKNFYQSVEAFFTTHKKDVTTQEKAALISFLRTGGAKPAWLDTVPASATDLTALQNLVTADNIAFETFKNAADKLSLNAAVARNKMREILAAKADADYSDTLVQSLNALGKVDDKDAAPTLLMRVFKDPTVVAYYLSGREAMDDPLKFAVDQVKQGFNSFGNAVKGLLSQIGIKSSDDITGPVAEAGGGFMGWLKNTFGGVADGISNIGIGGIAGAGGIGALFYIIANSLAGNSWFGKIIGVMAGIFGMVLGARAFGGSGDAPAGPRSDSPAGARSESPAARQETPAPAKDDKTSLRSNSKSAEPLDEELVALLRANNLCNGRSYDTNNDCRISDDELAALSTRVLSRAVTQRG